MRTSWPLAGLRPKLAAALQVLGLIAPGDTIEAHLRPDEPDWAFGSLVRCSLSHRGKKSGSVIPASVRHGGHDTWFENCTKRFLSALPERLQAVVMLSTDVTYVERCHERIAAIRPGTVKLNRIAYGDGKITWVHIIHLGGQGFNHMNAWLAGPPGRWGDNMRLAVDTPKGAGILNCVHFENHGSDGAQSGRAPIPSASGPNCRTMAFKVDAV